MITSYGFLLMHQWAETISVPVRSVVLEVIHIKTHVSELRGQEKTGDDYWLILQDWMGVK